MNAITTSELVRSLLAVLLGGGGVYLMLPRHVSGVSPRRAFGAGGAALGLGLLLSASFWTPPGSGLGQAFFYLFGLTSIAAGALMISSRDPVHSALWFAAVVLSTSGLFLIAGAQFLAAGTVIVYAGAIIVTFLFVIMLAQMEGRAPYDRAARAPGRSVLSCFLLMWALTYALLSIRAETRTMGADGQSTLPGQRVLVPTPRITQLGNASTIAGLTEVVRHASRPTAQLPERSNPAGAHVAGLGATLFTDHLITVELAGALLFVALVGAIAIATPKPPIRPGSRTDRLSPAAAPVV